MATFTQQITDTSNDVYVDGGGYFTATGLQQGFDSNSSTSFDMGLRFTNVTIPAGAAVQSASIALYVVGRSGSASLGRLYGDNVANATPWSTASNPDAITKTSASANIATTATGAMALDVTGIVSAILGRSDWQSGNAIRFGGSYTSGTALAQFADAGSSPANAATLTVNYTAGATLVVTKAGLTLSANSVTFTRTLGVGFAPLTLSSNTVGFVSGTTISFASTPLTLTAGAANLLTGKFFGVSPAALTLAAGNVSVVGGTLDWPVDLATLQAYSGGVNFYRVGVESVFTHDWSANYTVTFSFKTDVIVSRSGLEQRRALRQEPRRVLQTRATVDSADAREFDRFLWRTQASAFVFAEPHGTGTPTVRLAETVSVNHLTSGVTQADVSLAVEPGTETFADPAVDASYSYGLRLAFPLDVNWSSNVSDTLLFPRETVDFDVGRIAVSRPIAFGTRTQQANTLLTDDILTDFFRYQRGRAGDFWIVSPLDDLVVVSSAADTLTVMGNAVLLDGVDSGIKIELTYGARYFRRVLSAVQSGDNTVLTLDYDIPDVVSPTTVRRAAWVRLARFASDDMTVTWVTSTVGQASVQTQTLPYAVVENPLVLDGAAQYFVDYEGWPMWLDPFDFAVNVGMARIGGDVTTRDWYEAQLQYIVNTQAPRLGVF